jgi:antitoxin VapB
MTLSTIFKNNKTQAIRIPKSAAFPDDVKQVDVIKQGENLLIVPVRAKSWEEFFKLPRIDADFLDDREQSRPQERNWD